MVSVEDRGYRVVSPNVDFGLQCERSWGLWGVFFGVSV